MVATEKKTGCEECVKLLAENIMLKKLVNELEQRLTRTFSAPAKAAIVEPAAVKPKRKYRNFPAGVVFR